MYLGIELASSADTAVIGTQLARPQSSAGHSNVSRNITVYHLSHSDMTSICHEVECLSLDAGGIHGRPFQMLFS